MGWTKAMFGRLTRMWSSKNREKSSSDSSSSANPPVFAGSWSALVSSSFACVVASRSLPNLNSPYNIYMPPYQSTLDRTEVAVTVGGGVPELTLRELNRATRSFSPAMVIARGHKNATLYRATLPIGKTAVAKRLGDPPSGTWTASDDDEFLRQQVLVLSRLRHDNLVRLLGYTITADVRVLLFEFADMGTLHDALHGTHAGPTMGNLAPAAAARLPLPMTLSWEQRMGIALDVARGLEYLHEAAALSHWGISSFKVLLFQGCRAKIAGYDLFQRRPRRHDEEEAPDARVPLDTTTTKAVMNCWYSPPEYLMTGLRSSRTFDVYSYGVLLLELLTGRKKCAAMPFTATLLQWAAPLLREGRVEEFMDPKLGTQYQPVRALKLATVAVCCLRRNPSSRPSMGDVARTISCDIIGDQHGDDGSSMRDMTTIIRLLALALKGLQLIPHS